MNKETHLEGSGDAEVEKANILLSKPNSLTSGGCRRTKLIYSQHFERKTVAFVLLVFSDNKAFLAV